MKNNDFYNHEHYPDPTAYKALENIERERITKLIKQLKSIIKENEFELAERIVLKDKRTGKIYR